MMTAVIGIVNNNKKKTRTEGETTALELKKRNEELEEELRQSKEREEHVRRQLSALQDRLRVAEDAEERLCSQLGDLEAEALLQARDYNARIVTLVNQVSQAHTLLNNNTNPPSRPLLSSS